MIAVVIYVARSDMKSCHSLFSTRKMKDLRQPVFFSSSPFVFL